MFCKNCGTEMSDTARFCSKCGNYIAEEQAQRREIVEDNHIKFQLRPTFDVLYQLLRTTGFVFILMFYLFLALHELWFRYPMVLLILIAIMVIIVIGKMIFGKLQHNNLKYNFYATKIEYIDGFINKEEKELKYKYIREITMSQSILESFCGIGTIRIFTSATSGISNGIYIHCVDNPQEQYRIIKEIIDEGTQREL